MTYRNFMSRGVGLMLIAAASMLRADTTFTFQNGANSYTGAADFSINTQYADTNGGNGTQWTKTAELGAYTVTGTGGYTARYLVKFGNLSAIPAGSHVVSASLALTFDYWDNGSGNLTGFYLQNSWDPASSRMGWLHRNGSADWGAAGASAAGVDTIAGKSFTVPALRAVGNQTVTMPLDPSVVQSWLDSPGTNQGIMLVNNLTGNVVNIVSTVGKAALRPKLTIVVASAGGVQVTVSPKTVSLSPGATQTFTASVTGSSNTAVNWTATGGTITSAGVFTAGATAGNFTVTATSAADSTKSDSAQVTIQQPTPVTVTVSPKSVTLAPNGTHTFTASVTGSSNTSVTWTATGGSITSAGVFTAGSTAGSFTVTAKSVADPTKSDSATVTIQAPVQVTVSPKSVTLAPNGTQTFTASVTGSSNTSVTWSATGGTITSSGVFTAGSTAGTFSVTATSVADNTKSDTAQVTINQVVSVVVSPTSASLQPGQTKQFTATVSGTSNTAVTWTATGGTISSSGLYTAGQTAGNFSVTATSAADSSKSGSAGVQITTVTTALPPVPRQFDGPYVVVQSPASGMHFSAPGTIRIYADPFDPNANDPDAVTVTYLLNGQSVGTFTGNSDRNGYFPFTVTGLAAGTYAITTQITTGGKTYTSFPVTVFVDNLPASSGPVFNLTGNVTLSGTQSMTYAGTASNPCTINGNGFQITSASGFSGTLNISNCRIFNLGTATNPAINVTTNGNGSIQLIGNVWETFGTVSVAANDTAQLVVQNNEFRENTLVPVTNLPIAYANETLPVVVLSGNSSKQKFFQGNNVGLSTVLFDSTQNWLIGGDSDAQSNILIGVRCGFTVRNSTSMVLRGNYSQHNYPHRMSQGDNFQLEGDGFLVEHNIIRDSSWPVRGMGGELRYNLIDTSGTLDQVIQGPMSNTNMHHNVLTMTVNQQLFAPGSGLRVMFNVDNVQFNNNTFDGGGTFMGFSGSPIRVLSGSFIGSLRNNVFYNFAGLAGEPMLAGDQGESTNPPLQRLRYADYNDFYNPDAPNHTNYGLGVVGLTAGSAGYGMHDLGGFNGQANPKFTAPTALPFPFAPQDIWNRVKTVSNVLSTYRAMYTPASGSPLINAGDPRDGSNINIGAVGNGESIDRFGKFGSGSGTPAAPVITSFTSNPSSIQAGQSATLSWSVTGATTLSISGIGTVTGTSTTVSPSTTTTYTLTATNSGGSSTATTTVTVSATPTITVSVSPSSASVATGGTQTFTATVTGTTNQSVTWTATGGTITSAGVFTAGTTAGSFTVKATSVQDTTKSGTASVTITAPQPITVSVAPLNPTLFANGTQQFTATVSNAQNTAVNWSATGGTISSTGLYTAGATTGTFTVTATSVQDPAKSGSTQVTIVTQTTGAHPRIFLDAPTLATLRNRMSANTAEWKRLKSTCDSYIGGTAQFINGNDYPDRPNVGEGYQGSGYYDAFFPLGLCYQTIRQSDPATAAKYAATGVSILMAMSDPNNQIVTDDNNVDVTTRDTGYGIRFFLTVMGVGYDWFHDVLAPAQLTQLRNAMNKWITTFETDPDITAYINNEQFTSIGNYLAGYYAAKCYAALAVQGDDPVGDTWWNDWYNHQHLQRFQPTFAANMTGGGWLEGFAQYGILASENHSLPALAVKTAKGIDIIHDSAHPYTFPLDNARYLMHFTWPSRDLIDDRGELYSTGDPNDWPGTPNVDIYRFYAGFLQMWGDPLAPMMHKYARDVKAALDAAGHGSTTEWIDFLFWDSTAPEADYTTTTPSFLAVGQGGVAARSDWSNTATFMSFLSGPYLSPQGHEHVDKGSIALERNRIPFVVNQGWLAHEPNGDAGWTLSFNDRWGNFDSTTEFGTRKYHNTFQVRHVDSTGKATEIFGEETVSRSDGARTKIARYEDGGSYVLAVGQFLEDMYRQFNGICSGQPAVTSWTREVVYLRPSQFVVYDRTGVCNTSLDQYLAFHFSANPVEMTAPATGLHRLDVNNGQFAGSMTTILPANAQLHTSTQLGPDSNAWNKMWRTEIRPTGTPALTNRWMTVFDLAPTAGQVAAAVPVNVTAGPAVGTLLQSSAGNSVVIAGTAAFGTAISGTVSYSVPAAQTRHVITDLAPGAGYTVTVTVVGSNHSITITQGGSSVATSNGVLTFQVSAAGQMQ